LVNPDFDSVLKKDNINTQEWCFVLVYL
jgi:hypothetical protein